MKKTFRIVREYNLRTFIMEKGNYVSPSVVVFKSSLPQLLAGSPPVSSSVTVESFNSGEDADLSNEPAPGTTNGAKAYTEWESLSDDPFIIE